MRRDPFGNPLHTCMHYKHGAYWYVKNNKWHNLGKDYASAMAAYASWVAPGGGMEKLVHDTFDWLERREKRGEIASRTVGQYRTVRRRIETAFAEFSPAQVKPSHITIFLDFHFEGSPSQGNIALTVLRHVFGRGVRWGSCEFNPAKQVERYEQTKRDRYITDAEFLRIWSEAPPLLRLIMDMCYLTAQRIGDVLQIRQADIDDEGIRFQQEKSKKRLLVESTPELLKVVKEARGLHKVAGIFLFSKTHSYPIDYQSVRRMWLKSTDLAGVEDARIHDIRAKSLTDADAEGIDATALAGHATKAMTERYLRLKRMSRVQSPTGIKKAVS